MIKLAAQRESIRRGILDAFEDIPTIIAVGCNKFQRFPSDVRLEESIDDLKTTLFAVIPDLIKMLMADTFGKCNIPRLAIPSTDGDSGQSNELISRIRSARHVGSHQEKELGS